MQSLQEIMKEYGVANVLAPKIKILLAKEELTPKEEELLDQMLETFFRLNCP